VKLYLSRWVCQEAGSNLRRVEEEASRAAADGSDVVVFPESFLHGYSQTVPPAAAREIFGRVSLARPATSFFFGTISEDRRNRLTVWRGGRELARYDKVHLFEPFGEPAIWDPGEAYAAVTIEGRTFGLLTCNDVRFPEQARRLRLETRADLLVVPAWWPWRRDDIWRTLLRARAIENGVWVAGCSLAACETPEERFAGAGNYLFDPHGDRVATQDDRTYFIEDAPSRPLIVDPIATFREVTVVQRFPRGPKATE
jgi:predicted amidohydrolase